ncbi:MAG: tetratricopeptide repeat protein [Thermodesulfobacteriota bacterium]
MTVHDYKGKDAYRTLGLRRGKNAIKRETSTLSSKRICIWVALFAMVALLNYFVFVLLGPIGKKGVNPSETNEHTSADTFAKCFDMGCKKYQEGDFRGAIEAYTEAIALKPDEIQPYFNRGIAYIDLHMNDKAIDDYNTVLVMNPDYAEAYKNRAWAYLQNGLFDYAIRDCSKALKLDPYMAEAYYTRGLAYKGKGMLETAKKDLQKSCGLGDSHGCKAYKEVLKPGDHEI